MLPDGSHRERVSVLVAEVPELDRAQKPCFYRGDGMTKGAYVRVHDGDRQLTSYEVQMLLSSRGQPQDDAREAITNALVHRDLSPSSRGSQVQIEMYPDRLVIRNPGGLYGPVTVDDLGEEGVSSSRNALLLRILEDVPIPGEEWTVCENRGSGIRAMLNSLRHAGMTAPRFDDRISAFVVAFPNHSLLNDQVVRWISGLRETGLADSQCLALAMLHDGTVLDNPTYRKAAGLDSRIATSELQDLVARELAEQIDTRRSARYRLAPRLALEDRPRRQAPADRREEILQALGEHVLSRSDIAARTGLTDQTVRRWLAVLRRENLVEATESTPTSKNTKYRRTGTSDHAVGPA